MKKISTLSAFFLTTMWAISYFAQDKTLARTNKKVTPPYEAELDSKSTTHESEVVEELPVIENKVSNVGTTLIANSSYVIPSTSSSTSTYSEGSPTESTPSRAENQGSSSANEGSSGSSWGYFEIGNVVQAPVAERAPANQQETQNKKILIDSVAITNGELVVRGKNLDTATSVKLVSGSENLKFEALSKDSQTLIAQGLSSTKILIGKAYDLIISNAYGQSTFPVIVEVADRSITAAKLAPLSSSQDGYVGFKRYPTSAVSI